MTYKRMILGSGVIFAVALLALSMTTITSADNSRQITVTENGRVIATVKAERSKGGIVDFSISREGQPEHTYRYLANYPALTASVNGREVFTYLPGQSGERNIDKQFVRQELVADMRILRTVRKSTKIVALIEIAYAAVSGDESMIFGEPSDTLRASVVRMEPASMTLSDCTDACIGVLGKCTESKETNEDKCYEGAFKCVGSCGNAPPVHVPVGTPES